MTIRPGWAWWVLLVCVCACQQEEGANPVRHERALSGDTAWLRLFTATPGKLRTLLERDGLDVTGSNHRLGWVDVRLPATGRTHLLTRLDTRITGSLPLDSARGTGQLKGYHDPDQVSSFLDQIATEYPHIAQKVTLCDNLPEGQVIFAMKISDSVEIDENEPTFLMDGQIHAREVMTAEVMLDAIDYLTSQYGTDPRVTRWVDEMEIWIVPVVNPDGAARVHTGDIWWRKNRSALCPDDPAEIGVDLNRNFSWNYRQCPGSSDTCSSDDYHGTGPASETETRCMQDLMAALRPMYYINYHSYGEFILWSSACGTTDEESLLSLVGGLLNEAVETDSGQTGAWTIGNSYDILYAAPGGADDHAYGGTGAVSFTLEINSTDFIPDYATWRDITVQRQRAAWGLLLDRTLDGPAITGQVSDAQTSAPIQARYAFADQPLGSGQWPLQTDAAGRFGRAALPDTQRVLVFSADGYLPETRVVQIDAGPAWLDVAMTAGVNQAPIARAGEDGTAAEGDEALLDGSQSFDPDGHLLTYRWRQTAGPAAVLRDADSATASFIAPAVASDSDLTFELVVSDFDKDSEPDAVHIQVQDVWPTVEQSAADTPLEIPDNSSTGVSSVIHFDQEGMVMIVRAQVDIEHTWVGDLHISLASPAGTQAVLLDGDGGAVQDLHQVFTPDAFIDENARGDWTLRVVDAAPNDAGRLLGWHLSIDIRSSNSCTTDEDCQLPHADEQTCLEGNCQVKACLTGWGNCNESQIDGCETDLLTDPDHCGDCDRACPPGITCQGGDCLDPGEDADGGVEADGDDAGGDPESADGSDAADGFLSDANDDAGPADTLDAGGGADGDLLESDGDGIAQNPDGDDGQPTRSTSGCAGCNTADNAGQAWTLLLTAWLLHRRRRGIRT